jgi:hypothetical protein
MKKIKNFIILIISGFAIMSCSEDDKAITVLLDNAERGAILRTTNFNGTYNIFNLTDDVFKFELALEEQDQSGGDDVSEVRIYQSFKDNTDDGTDNAKPEALVSTTPKSAMGTSENGYPTLSTSLLLSEALAINGLTVDDVFGGDQFKYRLELEMTDGRVFSNTVGGTVSGGSFFSSPFEYTVTVKCVPVVPFSGDYILNLKDSYGDGWDGAFITVTIDGDATDYTAEDGGTVHTVTVPDGTAALSFVYTSGSFEEEHTYIITGPFGVIAAEDGPAPATGEIILNICN